MKVRRGPLPETLENAQKRSDAARETAGRTSRIDRTYDSGTPKVLFETRSIAPEDTACLYLRAAAATNGGPFL